jgi:hypothetical protein
METFRPVIGFDAGHGARYTTDLDRLAAYDLRDRVWYSYMRLRRLLERDGFEVRSVDTSKPSTLAGVRLLVIVRPRTPLAKAAVDAADRVATTGGSVLLVQNWLAAEAEANGTEKLAERWGVSLVPLGMMAGLGPNLQLAAFTDFYLNVMDRFEPHAISSGVSRVAMHETCGLAITGQSAALVGAGALPGLVAGQRGAGRFAVLADSEALNDLLLGLFDNERMASNLFRWLAYPVAGATPLERMVTLLKETGDPEARLAALSHVGDDELVLPKSRDGDDWLFEIVARYAPEALMRSLFGSAELRSLEASLFGSAQALPDGKRIRRILQGLGLHLPLSEFGRPRHVRHLEQQRRVLMSAEDGGLRLEASWELVRLFEALLRELFNAYGALVEADPVALMALLAPEASTDRSPASAGTWLTLVTRLLERIASEPQRAAAPMPARDWAALRSQLTSVGAKLVATRNRLAHAAGVDDTRAAVRDLVTAFEGPGGELLRACAAYLPEVIRVDGATEDSSGRLLRAITDDGAPRRLITSESPSLALTYFHFPRTSPAMSINPVLVPRQFE